jgi:DNA-binding response OmpR family regulator
LDSRRIVVVASDPAEGATLCEALKASNQNATVVATLAEALRGDVSSVHLVVIDQ